MTLSEALAKINRYVAALSKVRDISDEYLASFNDGIVKDPFIAIESIKTILKEII